MKKIYFFSSLLVLINCVPALCNWQPSYGPYGGIIQSLVKSNNVIVAGCHGNEAGIYISENNGVSWKKVLKSERSSNLTSNIMVKNIIQKDDEEVFYIAAEDGIHKLHKPIDEWEIKTIGFGTSPEAITITDITYVNGHLYVAFWGKGIKKSTNEGLSWILANVGLDELNVSSFNHTGDTIYVGTEHGLYFSKNRGASWDIFDTALIDSYIIKILTDNEHICLAEFRAGAFIYSKDGTLITRATPVGEYESSIIPFSLIDGQLYGQFKNKGLYYTALDNISWKKITTEFDNTKPLTLINSSNELLVGTQGFGVFRSTDSGVNWQASSQGIKAYKVNAIESIDNVVYLATSVSGLFISEDNGLHWRQGSEGITGSTFNDIVVKDDIIYLAGYGLFVSKDSGQSFIKKDERYFSSMAANKTTVYAASLYEGIISSKDNGNSWQDIEFFIEGNPVHSIDARDSILLIGTHYDGPFLSIDNGINWQSIQSDLTGHAVRSVAIKNNIFFITTGCGVGTCQKPTGAYRSIDFGKTWQYKNMGIGYELFKIQVKNNIVYSYYLDQMLYSLDNANTWKYFSDQIVIGGGRINAEKGKTGVIGSFSASEDYLYLGTENGLFFQENNLVAITSLQDEIDLQQNNRISISPNPFSTETSFSYSLNEYEPNLKLLIYDYQGRHTKTINPDGNMPGFHTFKIPAGSMQSGVFMYHLIGKEKIDSGKFVITK